MARNRLNLSDLRNDRLPRLISHKAADGRPLRAWEDVIVSRRHLFGAAALAGIGLSPAVRLMDSLAHAAEGPATWEVTPGRVVFRLRGRDRWVIDAHMFGGNPRLLTRRESGRFIVHLTGATFPGTCLPADFVCELRESPLSWRMNLSFLLGAFRTEVPFEKWLMGEVQASSTIQLETAVCGMGLAGQLQLAGSGSASFSPDWRFELAGSRLVRYQGQEADLISDRLRLALLDQTTPSMALASGRSRTLLALDRSTHRWSLSPGFETTESGTVVYPDNAFQTVHFETWDEPGGSHACVMLAEGAAADSSLWFHPDLPQADPLDEPIAFPLAQVQYARLFDPQESTRQQVLRAQFRAQPVPLKVFGCRLDVGGDTSAPMFELLQVDGATQTCCEPAVQRLAVPFAGGIAEPIELPRGTRLIWDGTSASVHPTVSILDQATRPAVKVPVRPLPASPSTAPTQVKPNVTDLVNGGGLSPLLLVAVLTNFRSRLEVVGPFTVSVVRPEDLLVLKFEFRGWTLQAAGGQQPKVVRTAPQATIVVHFPAQHIAEQSFFEPADPRNKEKPVYPIQARLAGSSRLVFAVPSGIAEIPYSLESLLDWSQFELVVTRAAAPPPNPPIMERLLIQPSGFLKQGLIPQLTPRSVPQEQPKKKPLPRPQSVPVPVPSGAFLWHVSHDEANPFFRARAALRKGYVQRVQLQQRQQIPMIRPQVQQVPQSAPPQGFSQLLNPNSPVERVTRPPIPPKPEELPNITAIEVPYRLFMSPSQMGGWAHALKPVAMNNRFELWHTRLGVRRQLQDGRWGVDERDEWYRTLRAIWSPDYRDNPADTGIVADPFRNLPEARHRHQLVHLMANGTIDNWQDRYARADRFMMSSLGAWMKTRYTHDPAPSPLTVVDWTQHTNMGRDQFVRVIEQGFLFPFGHRAVLIQITERKIERPIPDGPLVALLRYREFIVVREPLKTYPGPGQGQLSYSNGRNFPYRSLRLTTLITPNLDPKESSAIPGVPPVAFWPHVSGQNFQFHVVGEDWAGDVTEFSTPLIFVTSNIGLNPGFIKTVRNAYAQDNRNTTQLSGQKISYGPSLQRGDTALETASITFGAEIPCDPGLTPACPPANINPLIAAVNPLFFPSMAQANVSIPAVKVLLGANAASAGTLVRYSELYRLNGFSGPNPGELFLVMVNPISMRFTDTTKAGGLAAPNMDIVGMSRLKGPVGGGGSGVATRGVDPAGADNFGKGIFNPQDYFKDAKILGGIPLAKLFPAPANLDEFKKPGGLVPSLKSEQYPDKIVVPFQFTIDNVQRVNLAPVLIFDPQLPSRPTPKKSKFTLKVSVVFRFGQPGAGAVPEPEFNSEGELTNFQLTIAQVIKVSFRSLKLVKKHGESVSPHPELANESEDGVKPVEFLGALKFLSNLQDLVGGGGSGWGVKPIIEPSPVSLKAGIAVTVPTINVGVFSLSNLKLSAAVIIFWSGEPVRFRLAISERNDPFCITVWLFGGGGFFAVEIEASERGVVLVEVLLEFGGKFAFDIGIASGGVYVMAGFYFKYGIDSTTGQKGVYLEGYLRMGGQVSVLGLITVSLEFKMMIAYEEKVIGTTATTKTISKRLWGEASLVVKIEILFFETSVTLRVQKEFQGETETVKIAEREHDYLWLVSNEARPFLVQNTVGSFVKPRKIYEMLSEQEWAQYAGAFAA